MAHVIKRESWADRPEGWHGEWEGGSFQAGISVIFFSSEEIGAGPRLHTHPYPETFIVRRGHARFTVEGKAIDAEAGQILVVPAGAPHKFENLGPGPLETTDIHASERFVTEWLE
ncbi:cupin domain-containing protein [Chelativorans salis]|uniref:Cupin domain-containing protein n=1 Tax=Chelativorans salis TaxID=2978478 RepID=A0ABT2LK38_9HYPH|nr:cupin domain-containing protein [Chelativorans sp. EGI FJ00035]MCT7374792.1 cupin domain-containing protein [Chelativorans sp. EGI FJ00035]